MPHSLEAHPSKRTIASLKIDWTDRLVNLDINRQKVKESPPYDPSKTVDWAYENHYHNYYGDIQPGDMF